LLGASVLAVATGTTFGCSPGDQVALAPVRASGSIGNTFRTRETTEEPREYSNQVTADVRANSFIWQPWFVTVGGDATVGWENEVGGTQGDASSLLIGGTAVLGILPLSRYPATLTYSHTDNRVDGDFSGSDSISDRVAFRASQAYNSNLRTSFNAAYQTIEQPDRGSEDSWSAGADITKTFNRDSLSLSLDYSASDFHSSTDSAGPLDEDTKEQIGVATFNYNAVFSDYFTVNNEVTGIYDLEDTERELSEERQVQGVSVGSWRSPDRPFTINGALRALGEIDSFDPTSPGSATREVERQSVNATLGANYQIIPGLTANGGANGEFENTVNRAGGAVTGGGDSTGKRSAGTLLAGLDYVSDTRPLAGFEWGWRAGTSNQVTYDTADGMEHSESGRLGHSFDRRFAGLVLDPIDFRFTQEGRVTHDNEDGAEPNITHRLSLTHNRAFNGTANFVRLSLSDSRDLAGDEIDELQLAHLILSHNSRLGATRGWNASLSSQVSRQRVSGGEEDYNASANGRFAYRHGEVCRVEDLVFTSELNLNAIGFEEVITGEDEEDTATSDIFRADWRNRLDYRIGRLVTSLETTLFQSRDEFGNIVLLRIRREFGGSF
jgi:hypothetical protein